MERFWRKINKTDSCWEWIAGLQSDGYGAFRVGSSMRLAHRVSYELIKGPISNEKCLDHICCNRKCVNPEHLREVTIKENTLFNSESSSARNSQKTHCLRGHELKPSNIRINKAGRVCRECRRIIEREYKRRARAKNKASTKAASII